MTHDVVITGIGMVTAGGFGFDAHWQAALTGETARERTLASFNAAPHVSDRRMLKSVSKADAIGIAALEGLVKDARLAPGAYVSERIGLYVGAPPASAYDNEYYVEAMQQANGAPREFGRTSMGSRPTTLLIGLPNNVLCYGAMILDAKGPNSNYTSTAMSGHMALINAAQRLTRGQVDLAVAGGFCAHTDPVNHAMFRQLGVARAANAAVDADGMELADGAVFVALETRAAAARRGARPLAAYVSGALASDGLGPLAHDERGAALENAVSQALRKGGVGLDQIGLVLACASGVKSVDRSELSVLSRVFAKQRVTPALGSSSRALGNLMEAGGLAEIALAARIFAAGTVPAAMRLDAAGGTAFTSEVDPAKPYALILRTSAWGEYACVVVRKEAEGEAECARTS